MNTYLFKKWGLQLEICGIAAFFCLFGLGLKLSGTPVLRPDVLLIAPISAILILGGWLRISGRIAILDKCGWR